MRHRAPVGRRAHVAALVVLLLLGVGLLVLAQRLSGGAADVARDPGPTGRSEGPARSGPTTGPTARDPDPSPTGSADPPTSVARGEALPPQWPEFRPSRLTLRPGAAGTSAPVDPVDVSDGTLSLPDDADRVGWWRGGSRAGAPFGTIVVAGHLDSVDDPAGFLVGLVDLRRGDLVELTSGSERQRYRVSSNILLPSADLSARSDLFEQQGSHRLLLITCGGDFDEEQGRYRDNRIVEAVPVPGG